MNDKYEQAIHSCYSKIRDVKRKYPAAYHHTKEIEDLKIEALREKAARENPQPLSAVLANTGMSSMPKSCAECKIGSKYGFVGDVHCRITGEYYTGNVRPPHKERPDECPLIDHPPKEAHQ